MGTVRLVGAKWFAYGRTRVLGPFNTEREAWRALKAEGEL